MPRASWAFRIGKCADGSNDTSAMEWRHDAIEGRKMCLKTALDLDLDDPALEVAA